MVFVIIIFMITGVTSLKHYGVTWDEGLGNLFFGEKNFQYITSLDSGSLDIHTDLSPQNPNDLDLNRSTWRQDPFFFPGLTDLPPTLTKYIFSYWLSWLNPIDGFHLYPILLASIFLWVFYRFISLHLGKFPAFCSVLFLATFPRFWGDMHFNVKDIPETIFYGFSLMSFLTWYESPKWQKAFLTGILMGAALGIKANALFIPLFLVATLVPWDFSRSSWVSLFNHLRKYVFHYLLMGLAALGVYS